MEIELSERAPPIPLRSPPPRRDKRKPEGQPKPKPKLKKNRLLSQEEFRSKSYDEKLDLLFETMNSRFEEMDSRFEAMDSRFEAMDSRIQKVESNTSNLNSELRALNAGVGDMRERELRKKIEQLFGKSFSKPYSVKSLEDLARLSLRLAEKPTDVTAIQSAANTLAQRSIEFLHKLLTKLTGDAEFVSSKRTISANMLTNIKNNYTGKEIVEEFGINALPRFQQPWRKFFNSLQTFWNEFVEKTEKRVKKKLTKCNSIGLQLFTMQAYGIPDTEVEFDCRGTIQCTSDIAAVIQCGECKSSEQQEASAKDQLHKRLRLLSLSAAQVLNISQSTLIARIFIFKSASKSVDKYPSTNGVNEHGISTYIYQF